MDSDDKRRIVEALILGAPEPIGAVRIADLIPWCKPGQVKKLVDELNASYESEGRSFEIWEVATGYQFRTRGEYAAYVGQLHKERPLRLSRAALETLAVVAYKQPVTRAEIEEVRGVDIGATVRGLVDRKLVRIAGHREVPGRPMLYATSRRFLEVFGLTSLEDLPTLREVEAFTADEADEDDTDAPPTEEAEPELPGLH